MKDNYLNAGRRVRPTLPKLTKASRAILKEMATGCRIIADSNPTEQAITVHFDCYSVATNVTAKDVETLLKVGFIATISGTKNREGIWLRKEYAITDTGRAALNI